MQWAKHKQHTGFTIVELLIVVVVIAILAAITIVAYNGIQQQARVSSVKSDLSSAVKQIELDRVKSGDFPANLTAINDGKGLQASDDTYFRYRADNASANKSFCIAAISGGVVYSATTGTQMIEGSCYNVALGASAPSTIITDGNPAFATYYSGPVGLQSVMVDLGSVQDISMIKVWHYWGNARSYHATKTEVSENGTNWTVVFDSATEGTYPETSAGKTISFPMQKARYVRDWTNGNTVNTGNHWNEIQVF